jgi:hypothetical protein
MFLACQKSKITIKLKFYYSNLKNAVETAKIAVDSCYVIRQFLTPLPSIDFREIRGLSQPVNRFNCHTLIVIHPLKTADWQSKARNNKYLKTRERLKTYC